MNDPRRFTMQQNASRALARQRVAGTPWLAPLTFLLLSSAALESARGQQSDLPSAAPDVAPAPQLPTPLGAGAGANAPAARPRVPAPPRPPAADAPLPAADSEGDATSPGNEGNGALFGGGGRGATAVPTVTRRVPYSFSLSVSAIYDDNTSLSQSRAGNGNLFAGNRSGTGGDFVFTIVPSFVFGLDNLVSARNDYLHFTYSPVVSFYVKSSQNDSVQHLIGLETLYHFGQFTLSARQTVQILDGTDTAATSPGPGALLQPGQTAGSSPVYPTGTINQANLDVSGRSRLNVYNTSLNASFAYSDKTSFSGGLQYDASVYSSLISSQNLTGSLYVNYVYSRKTVISVGLSGGHTFVDDPSPDQNFVQTNLRFSYRYSDRLTLAGSAGIEFRQAEDQSGLDTTPIFDLSASYRLTDSTNFSLAATRSVQNSAVLAGQNFQSTGLTFNVQQIINSRLSASLTLGFQNAHYVSVTEGVNASRDESYFTISPTLSVALRPGLTLSLFYVHRENNSTGAGSRSFSNNQGGLSVGYAF